MKSSTGAEAGAVARRAHLAEGRAIRRTGALPARLDEPGYSRNLRARWRRSAGSAPVEAVKAVRMAYELPFAEGVRRERDLHGAAARRPVERSGTPLPSSARSPACRTSPRRPRPGNRCRRVVGSGVMGRGIAVCLANAGVPVVLLAHKAGATAALAAIQKLVRTGWPREPCAGRGGPPGRTDHLTLDADLKSADRW
jgi:3-hydroxyacyl-CoA dehydrogenase